MKLNYEKAEEIRKKWFNGTYNQQCLADEYGVTQAAISDIVRSKTYTHSLTFDPNGIETEVQKLNRIVEGQSEKIKLLQVANTSLEQRVKDLEDNLEKAKFVVTHLKERIIKLENN